MKTSNNIIAAAAILVLCVIGGSLPERPPPEDGPRFARWLIARGTWGVLNTLDRQNGFPFGNVVSYSDGSTGVPYFYLSKTFDPTGPNALSNNRSSFTFSEQELGTCDKKQDTQSPLCAKITLSGQLYLLPETSPEAAFGEKVLFANHPQLAGWPKNFGNFGVFKLVIGEIFLVNELKPFKKIPVRSYLDANA